MSRAPRTRRRPVPRARQPNAIRLSYSQALSGVLKEARALVDERLVPMLPRLVASAAQVHDAVTPKNYAEMVEAALADIAKTFFDRFPQERLRNLALSMGRRTSEFQKADLKRQVASRLGQDIGIDVFAERGMAERIDAFASANAQLIKSIPSQFFDQVASRTVQSLRTGERAEDIAGEIRDRYGVSQSRARLVARDQVGKLFGEVNRARQQNLGIDSFVWRTSEDERVREEHVALDGQKFPWSSPPSEGIPGEPIACRCTAEPVLDDLLD